MKKGFFKALVATAVLGATMAVSGVVAMATPTTTVYNVAEITSAPSSGTVLAFDDTSANITWGGGSSELLTDSPYTGAVPYGVTLTKRIRAKGGSRTVSIDLKSGDTVDFYVCSTDSNDASKTATYTLKKDGVVVGTSESISNTDGKEVKDVSFEIEADGTYVLSTDNSRLTLFAITITRDSDAKQVYWPTAVAQTDSSTAWIGGEGATLLSGSTLSGATNNGGDSSNKNRIRIGKAAYGDSKETPTIANCGYITFTRSDSFNISVKAASSGNTSSRTFYLGTVDDENFTDVKTFTVTGNTGETVTAKVESDGEQTYAIYVKPYNTTNDTGETVVSAAENTDIMEIAVYPTTAVYSTTPAVTLSTPVVADGKLTVTGTFNKFSGSLYEVYEIILNAAKGKDTQDAAVWTENDITNLKDNGDGTASFVATVDDPAENVRFQAIAKYNGVDDATSDIKDAQAVSNLAKYTVAE